MKADVIIIGAGLAGLVAAHELTRAGRSVLVLDQEGPQSQGGQAFWSLGGLFFVDSPEQRRLRIRDSYELALTDWLTAAGFDREEDHWPRRWAEAYVAWAAGEKRSWLHGLGMRWFPVVGWAERRYNSVPRFHVTWGTGPGVVEPFLRQGILHRHRVDELLVEGGAVVGVRGKVLEDSAAERGRPTSRTAVRDFELRAQAVIVASGGIGGNFELVRKAWPARMGAAPASMICGVPDHVDGRGLELAQAAGARLINGDRLWAYVEGIQNWAPLWTNHAIRILPGPSSVWLDARGQRLPAPYFPGYDTLGTLEHLRTTGHDYSWLVLTQSIIKKEFALSGSEQNPDLTGRSWRQVLGRAVGRAAPGPVEKFKQFGVDFVVRSNLRELVDGMNGLTGQGLLDLSAVEKVLAARDGQLANPFCSDLQVAGIHNARRYLGDRLIRTARPHRILDPAHGPLIAVRCHILTRKTLGGLETDLGGRILGPGGSPVPGLYAAGEAAGFGGGGVHGYRALEGTFLGGCLFSGRAAGRAAAEAVL